MNSTISTHLVNYLLHTYHGFHLHMLHFCLSTFGSSKFSGSFASVQVFWLTNCFPWLQQISWGWARWWHTETWTVEGWLPPLTDTPKAAQFWGTSSLENSLKELQLCCVPLKTFLNHRLIKILLMEVFNIHHPHAPKNMKIYIVPDCILTNLLFVLSKISVFILIELSIFLIQTEDWIYSQYPTFCKIQEGYDKKII